MSEDNFNVDIDTDGSYLAAIIVLIIVLALVALTFGIYVGLGYVVMWALATLGMVGSYGVWHAVAVAALLWVATILFG